MSTVYSRIVTQLALVGVIFCAQAQTDPAVGISQTTTGQSLQWRAQDASQGIVNSQHMKGKVSVVFVWATSCSVCRSALPELRANAAGWKDKPFALITLNVDTQRADWQNYEKLVERTSMPPRNLHALWMGTLASPVRLPLTLVVDAKGKVIARYEGRMAPEAWDGVAELLL